MLKNLRKIYSPNFNINKRKAKDIRFVILHYTGMKDEKLAIEKLTSSNSKVSCHYFIKNSGEILNFVPDLYVSWHAGKSSWKNIKSLNFNSLGIEISNPGHDNKYNNFNIKQIKSLIYLISLLKKKYNIKKKNILGHSDISPNRKKDPGEKFPWALMYKKKLCIWHNIKEKKLKRFRNLDCNKIEKSEFFKNLEKIGYNTHNKKLVILAFQRRFRQISISGKVDKECLLISISIAKNK